MLGRVVAVVVTMVGLAACQTMPPAAPATGDAAQAQAAFDERRVRMTALDQWTAGGRVAVNAHGRGWTGSLDWHQADEVLDVRFLAPLGAGTVRITGAPGAMRVQASDGTDFESSDVGADLARWLGAPLPVEALRWWMLGLPHPEVGLAALILDAAGRATRIEQAGWTVTYPRYSAFGDTVVPGIVVAEGGAVRVRIVIERWISP